MVFPAAWACRLLLYQRPHMGDLPILGTQQRIIIVPLSAVMAEVRVKGKQQALAKRASLSRWRWCRVHDITNM